MVWADVVNGPGHVLDGQGHRPDAVVGVAVEARILSTPTQVILRLVLVSGLKHIDIYLVTTLSSTTISTLFLKFLKNVKKSSRKVWRKNSNIIFLQT